MANWWETFFDADYLRVWGGFTPDAATDAQSDALWQLLSLREGSRVLDAPCGYGRFSKRLAQRGAHVIGVDQSADLLANAEANRGGLAASQLSYRRQDLRQPLGDTGFDVALNLFSSLGYGTDEDDLAILTTLRDAVRPGGKVFVDTMHRDAVVVRLARGVKPSSRLPDGTLVIEEPKFDPLAGRIETAWHWSGPGGAGVKRASLRIYSATELIRLLERAGLKLMSAHAGISTAPFNPEAPDAGGRLGLLARRS